MILWCKWFFPSLNELFRVKRSLKAPPSEIAYQVPVTNDKRTGSTNACTLRSSERRCTKVAFRVVSSANSADFNGKCVATISSTASWTALSISASSSRL